jgi:hypothetical protein
MNKEKILLENEFNLIADGLNGILFESSIELGIENQQLIMEIEDSIKLDNLDIKWGVDSKKLIEKLKRLNVDESFELIKEIYKFWGKNTDEIQEFKLKNEEKKTMINKVNKNITKVEIPINREEALKQFPVDRSLDDKSKTEEIIIVLNRLYQNEKEQLKGLFTLGEANLLITAFNGFIYTPWNDDKGVLLRMVDGTMTCEYTPDDYYFVDREKVFDKLHKLTTFQSFVVIRMAIEFWMTKKGVFEGEQVLREIFGIE